MKTTGRYCSFTDDYDIDSIISSSVEKTEKFVNTLLDEGDSQKDRKAILLAIMETVAKQILTL